MHSRTRVWPAYRSCFLVHVIHRRCPSYNNTLRIIVGCFIGGDQLLFDSVEDCS